jgi:uncharacterized protein
MSQENVEIVRQAIEANRSDDVEANIETIVALSAPDSEYTRVTAAVEPQTYRGHDGIRRYFSDMADSWKEWRIEAQEIRDIGPDRVVATIRFRAIGRGSGVPIDAQLGYVAALSDGRVVHARTYPSRAEALEAVGLSE